MNNNSDNSSNNINNNLLNNNITTILTELYTTLLNPYYNIIHIEQEEQQEEEKQQEDEQEEKQQEEGKQQEEQQEEQEQYSDMITTLLSINNQSITQILEERLDDVMKYAYENTLNINDNIIKFIDLCYLKNMQFDDDYCELIRYTIRTVLSTNISHSIKIVASNILGYCLIGKNYIFSENMDMVNEFLREEVKRVLRQLFMIEILSQSFQNNIQMNDVPLVLEDIELEKIPIKNYKDIEQKIRDKNNKCTVCQEDFRINDETRILQCEHIYHTDCIDGWLTNHSYKCPCCREPAGKHMPKV